MNEIDTGATVNMRKLEERLARKPLDEVATIVQGLTYGEMIELAATMWKSQPEGTAITQDNLPTLLHLWSKGGHGFVSGNRRHSMERSHEADRRFSKARSPPVSQPHAHARARG